MKSSLAAVALLLLGAVACGGGGGGVPVFEQSDVHFDGCPTAPADADATCRAVATVRNSGSAGSTRQVFYFTLHSGSGDRQATCTPDVPSLAAGASTELSCQVSVPAGSVPSNLVLSGR